MAVGGPGADSSVLLTRLIGGKPMIDVAAELFGQMRVLWGRYFTSVATTGLVEYCGRRAACLTLVVAPDDRRLLNGSAVGDR